MQKDLDPTEPQEQEKLPALPPDYLLSESIQSAMRADEFLWKGSPNPTIMQRAEAWIVGGAFLVIFLMLANELWTRPWSSGSLVALFPCLFSFWVGARIFRNGFRRRVKPLKENPSKREEGPQSLSS